jgi:hypothetical protein
MFWCLLAAAHSSSLNISDGGEQWHRCSSDNDDQKKKSFEKKSVT